MEEGTSQISQDIRKLVSKWEGILKGLTEEEIGARKNRQGRNIRQIIGHLVDSASNNHQRIIRLQYTSNLVFPDYTNENDLWISIQQYEKENWSDLLSIWKFFNYHIAHTISNIDKSWLKNEWSDGSRDPISLEDTVFNYLAHMRLHLNEIQVMLHSNTN